MRSAKARASAPGKVILFGEHAVVYGQPSISLAVDRRTTVEAETATETTVNGRPMDANHHAYIRTALRLCEPGTPVRLQTRSDLPSSSGMGSSAALSVATVAALLSLQGPRVDAPRVAELAFLTEFETQGAASPNDTTVSTAGGGVLLASRRLEGDSEFLWEIRHGDRAWFAHRLRLPPLPLVVATTGRRSRTADQVAKVRRFVEHNAFARDLIAEIGRITHEAVQALGGADLARVGQLMNLNQECLHTLGVDSPELQRLIAEARAVPGTYGAKLTGAGGGGSMIALTERPEEVQAALTRLGVDAHVLRTDAEGLRLG